MSDFKVRLLVIFPASVTVEPDAGKTVTVDLSVNFPSVVVTVISALPVVTPETVPSAATVATAALLVVQVTVLSDASTGATDTVNLSGVPILTVATF